MTDEQQAPQQPQPQPETPETPPAPTTDGRALTSAANGAKSQGPVTPEGKLRSSRNAQKHGMHSNAIVLHHESAEAYEELRQKYFRDFTPTNQSQSDLVDQMTAAIWRLRRLAALESAAMDHAVEAQRAQVDATYIDLDCETRAHLAFDKLATSSSTLVTYNRFQASQVRIYDRALRNLRFLQQGEEAAAARAGKTRMEPTSSK